eukprot:CAMPEP_0119545676 /NCGR_PEP_ID=MMETSP1352-20130426/358_1 /TAXON_ID=265584 /ORGANISM="Stauroneis constricta, Strain CCMP1120" /LENGTH=311 /DNA_ID=CAMNT_0007590255 /DNA_START=66 /DNA_END=1001 /DNA_ORIENTATION=+
MKFAFVAATLLSVASAMTIKGQNAANKVISKARLLDQQNGQEEEQDYGEYGFLTQYSLKLISCKAGEVVVNQENGEYEYNAVVVRLCPADSCNDDSGCGSGYGDMVVGLNTFVEAYFEDQRDNMNWGDDFNPDEYTECREYEMENEGDDANNGNNDNGVQYFVGPTCADDGVDIKVGFFSDEMCTVVSETSFEEISNGWSLPFSDGGMVSTECNACLVYNDNYEQELRELCERTYANAGAKCEEKMEYFSYYGQNVAGCEYVQELVPKASASKKGGAVFGWILFVLIVIGVAGYVMWWRNKKATASDGLMN